MGRQNSKKIKKTSFLDVINSSKSTEDSEVFTMHLAYTNEISGGQQTSGWLSEKAPALKSKFDTDQKNLLEYIAQTQSRER
jgi:hypothetical protein